MNLKEFISFSKAQLNSIINLNGAVLYSSVNSLTRGEYYILGLNPGGSADSGQSIETNLDSLQQYYENSYLDESWYHDNNRIGEHPIQKGLTHLFNYLKSDLRNVCSSNLIFYRSRNDRGISFWKDGEECWPVHEKILSIVIPKIIITIGNGPKSAFRFLCYKNDISFQNVKKIKTNHKGYNLKYFIKSLDGSKMMIIGLPHLSRYPIENDLKSLMRIKEEIEKYWLSQKNNLLNLT